MIPRRGRLEGERITIHYQAFREPSYKRKIIIIIISQCSTPLRKHQD